jgi:hypothetical protein
MPQGRKQETFTPPPIECADIENTDNAGQLGDQNPYQGPELPEKRELFISHGVQKGQQRNVKQRQGDLVARIFD